MMSPEMNYINEKTLKGFFISDYKWILKNLNGFPINKLDTIKGDYRNYIKSLKTHLKIQSDKEKIIKNIKYDNKGRIIYESTEMDDRETTYTDLENKTLAKTNIYINNEIINSLLVIEDKVNFTYEIKLMNSKDKQIWKSKFIYTNKEFYPMKYTHIPFNNDNKENWIEYHRGDNSFFNRKIIKKYDTSSNIIEFIEINLDTNIEEKKSKMFYDSRNREIQSELKTIKYKEPRIIYTKYDEKDNCILVKTSNKEDIYFRYKYSEKGGLTLYKNNVLLITIPDYK